jgi:hypothetical protein
MLIKIFPTTAKAHSNSFENFSYDLISFSVKKSFNIQELLHHKSKHHGTKPMHTSSSRAFQRHQEHNLKHRGLVDLITTKPKQNKQSTFLHR